MYARDFPDFFAENPPKGQNLVVHISGGVSKTGPETASPTYNPKISGARA